MFNTKILSPQIADLVKIGPCPEDACLWKKVKDNVSKI